jgi:hypothetical protein
MPRPVAHHHLAAEAQSFPLASRTAFDLRLTTLSRQAAGVLDGKSTTKLAAALEDHLRPRAGGMSLEILRQLRDAAWFPPDRRTVPLGEHLGILAARHLEYSGRRVALRADGDPTERATCWRWLSLALPADLLVSALAAREGFEPPDNAVQIVTPRLAEVLRRPCAETHLHVGAGVPFGLLWAARMRALAEETSIPLKSAAGSPPFGSPAAFRSMLLAAATVRLLLASFLWRRDETGAPASFDHFRAAELPHIADRLPWGFGAHEAMRALHHALAHLWARVPAPPIARARRLYQALAGRAPRPSKPEQERSLEAILDGDPLAAWLPVRCGLGLPETRFAARAMRYLAGDGHADTAFAVSFWQYQRVRCLTYRYLVEEPGTAGLDWFTRHYARISPLRGQLTQLTYASALHLQSTDLFLAALEARTAPHPHWNLVRDEVRDLAEQAARFEPLAARERPEVGLVLHFIKEWERGLPGNRTRLHADPRHRAFGCRFGPWFHERLQQAMAIETALRHNPELLLVLRGVDVANVELAEPTWPLVPLFRRVREAARRASARLAWARPRWEAAPLRVTVHAGEDFRRLVEGLRHIHEPIEFDILRVGDRIGHGVALGEDPQRWAESARLVTQPAEDRLDDLLWELERYRRAEIPADTGRLEHVRAEATRLGRMIYDGPERVDLDDLVEARQIRHRPEALAWVGYPFIRERTFDRAPYRLFYRYLTDAAVFERGQRAEEVHAVESEVAMLRAAQRSLRGRLGRMEITVESNPSSNLLIADYLGLDEHAAFRFQPLSGMPEPEGGPVMVSLNTDNPVTFASCLADEFAHVYFALLGRGVAAGDALAWLDRARENGHRSRFTLRASAVRDEIALILPEPRRPGDQRERDRPGAAGVSSSS